MSDARPPELAFADGNLHVAYRASAEPQKVTLDVELSKPDGERRVPMHAQTILEEISGGGAGGVHFSPTQGAASCSYGPLTTDVPEAAGPRYHYEMTWTAVAPRYLRHIVELIGATTDVARVSIAGTLPLDDSELSATEAVVRQWLERPRTHLRANQTAFKVHERPLSGRRAFVRLHLVGDTSDDVLRAFDDALLVWTGMLFTYGDRLGGGRSRVTLASPAGRALRELACGIDLFVCEPEPARALLCNVMAAFHERVAAIDAIDLGIPQ